MQFSQVDAISQERRILARRKDAETMNVFGRLFNSILYPRKPKHTFSFYVPQYLFIRSVSFCEDVTLEIDDDFHPKDLAQILYTDFLEYVRKTNDVHNTYKRLNARDLSPTSIKPYQTEEAYKGVVFEEMRGFEEVKTLLDHRAALKGEFLLSDMMEIYQDHTFTLENILEIIYCDFMDDYRRGLIKNPINKITQYL